MMIEPVPRDLQVLHYLYNEPHSTQETAEHFGLKPDTIAAIVRINALNMASAMTDHVPEHAKNLCVQKYSLSRDTVEALIRQVAVPEENPAD